MIRRHDSQCETRVTDHVISHLRVGNQPEADLSPHTRCVDDGGSFETGAFAHLDYHSGDGHTHGLHHLHADQFDLLGVRVVHIG